MGLHLVTGYKGSAHVTSADQGAYNASTYGAGDFVFEVGKQFAVSVISNNLIRILDGEILMQGRHVSLKRNTYEELNIANGLQGLNRNDLIVARYTKDASTGVENVAFVVIQGVSTEGTASDPEYTTGDILEGDCLLHDMPLYRIPLTGLNVGTPVKLFNTVGDFLNHNHDTRYYTETEIDAKLKAQSGDLTEHIEDTANPHNVTKTQVGLGNVPNVATNDQTPSYTMASANTALVSGEKLSVAFGKISKAVSSLISHLANVSNPHGVTKAQVGLGNVDNTADSAKSVKYATSAGSATKATQDASGNVIASTYATATNLTSHTGNKSNPHGVTKAQVGLSNVPNVATNDQTPTYTVPSESAKLVSGEKMSVAFGKIAKSVNNLIASDGTAFRFGVDADGKFGYIVTDSAGADTVIPFKSGIDIAEIEVFNATSGCIKNTGNLTREASLALNKGKYIICANGEGATGSSGYTNNYYLKIIVGGTEVGADVFKYLDETSDYKSLRAITKYCICEIQEDNTEVTATFYSDTWQDYNMVGAVGLQAFKLA